MLCIDDDADEANRRVEGLPYHSAQFSLYDESAVAPISAEADRPRGQQFQDINVL